MRRLISSTAVFVAAIALGAPLLAQAEKPLAIPGFGVSTDIPNAKQLPDPNMVVKVLFDVSKAAPKPDDVNPILEALARYINTLDKWGVPADHRKLAVIFHQGGAEIVMNNAAYRERTGHDNPNIALIQALKKAGVELHVCGQGVLARKIDPKTILPEIDVDLWALVTIVNFEMQGYARIGG